jgi:uncharacterized membrane protein (UPF0127 family)
LYHAPVRLLAAVLLLVVACAPACEGSDDGGADVSPAGLPVIDLRYDSGTLRVEVASTPAQRALGLGNRDSLGEREGMLFDLGELRVPSFWMKDTRIPLDMIWIDEERRVVEIDANVQPQTGVRDVELRRYRPAVPVRWALEVNGGGANALGIDVGDVLQFTAPQAPRLQ